MGARVCASQRGKARSANRTLPKRSWPPVTEALKHPARQSGEDSQDWSEVGGGSFIDMIVEGIFGTTLGLDGTSQVDSRVQAFDSEAALTGLMIRGKPHEISVKGSRTCE